MGTWNIGIKDNDTSMEVYEDFFRKYNNNESVNDIRESLLKDCESDLNDFEARHNVLFALALCLWKVKRLDNNILNEIKDIINCYILITL